MKDWLARRRAREEARSLAIWRKGTWDYDEIPADLAQEWAADAARQDLLDRWAAIRALWGRPIVTRIRHDGVRSLERGRCEEWRFDRAVIATVALIFGFQWTSEIAAAWSRRHGRHEVWAADYKLAFWGAESTGYGWSSTEVLLRGWCCFEIVRDGDATW